MLVANGRPAAAGRALLGMACVFVLFSFYFSSARFESLIPACGCWLVSKGHYVFPLVARFLNQFETMNTH